MDSSEDEMLSEAVFELEKSLEKKDFDFSFAQSTNFQSSDRPNEEALKVLFTKFGHKEFRPMQWQIINSILKDKRDNCAIMTTGYGKSLCYQFPAVFSNGITIVISPLISLMEDQVLSLTVANIPACLLGMAQKNTMETIEAIVSNKFSLVYLTPEWCTSEFGTEILEKIRSRIKITLIAIDEAHCVSSWGHDFRHSFRKLGMLKKLFRKVPLLAVTATANEKVKLDIINVLGLENPQILCSALDRPNLYFEVRQKSDDIFNDLRQLMVRRGGQWMLQGPTIIYCTTRKDTEAISDLLTSHHIVNMPYHAGLVLKSRQSAHELFSKDKISVVVATIAFGMGIDKPDIRNVIHYGTSNSMEGYYQEVGRAGRDGLASKCVTFYGTQDFAVHQFLIEQCSTGSYLKHKETLLDHMKQYLVTTECRRKYILSYFEDSTPTQVDESKNCCDNCLRKGSTKSCNKYDFSEDVTKYLSAVETLGGRYGHGMYIMFLKGSKNAKLLESHRRSVYFGRGANKSEAWWKAVGNFLEMKGYLNQVKLTTTGYRCYVYETSEAGKLFLSQPKSKRKFMEVPNGKLSELLRAQLPPSTTGWRGSSGETIGPAVTATQNGANVLELNSKEEQEKLKLFRFLRNTRTELARSNDCMPYMIASDYVLMEMAKKKPMSLSELSDLRIEGLTEAKINKFCEKFVDVIRNNCSEKPMQPSKDSLVYVHKVKDELNDDMVLDASSVQQIEDSLPYGDHKNDEDELSDSNDDMLAALCDEMQKQASETTQDLLSELSSNVADLHHSPLAKKLKINSVNDCDIMVDSLSKNLGVTEAASVEARNAKKKLPAWLSKKKK